jgi:hypothetical protein
MLLLRLAVWCTSETWDVARPQVNSWEMQHSTHDASSAGADGGVIGARHTGGRPSDSTTGSSAAVMIASGGATTAVAAAARTARGASTSGMPAVPARGAQLRAAEGSKSPRSEPSISHLQASESATSSVILQGCNSSTDQPLPPAAMGAGGSELLRSEPSASKVITPRSKSMSRLGMLIKPKSTSASGTAPATNSPTGAGACLPARKVR